MSCMDVNTQFIGLSRIPVIFGESVYNMWPFLPDQVNLKFIACWRVILQWSIGCGEKKKNIAIEVMWMKRKSDAVLIIWFAIIC